VKISVNKDCTINGQNITAIIIFNDRDSLYVLSVLLYTPIRFSSNSLDSFRYNYLYLSPLCI